MLKLNIIDNVVLLLLIIGGLHLGLVAFADLNLVTKLAGDGTMLAKVIYGLIALSAVYAISIFVREKA